MPDNYEGVLERGCGCRQPSWSRVVEIGKQGGLKILKLKVNS